MRLLEFSNSARWQVLIALDREKYQAGLMADAGETFEVCRQLFLKVPPLGGLQEPPWPNKHAMTPNPTIWENLRTIFGPFGKYLNKMKNNNNKNQN